MNLLPVRGISAQALVGAWVQIKPQASAASNSFSTT